jgi:hypothetical protein
MPSVRDSSTDWVAAAAPRVGVSGGETRPDHATDNGDEARRTATAQAVTYAPEGPVNRDFDNYAPAQLRAANALALRPDLVPPARRPRGTGPSG